MQIDGILFDLDGTLVDSAVIIAAVLDEMRLENGLPPHEVDHYRKWVSLGAERLIQLALGAPENLASSLVASFRTRYGKRCTPAAAVYPHVFEALAVLSRENVQLGVCSNKPTQLCNKVLSDTGLEEYFSCVVGGDATPYPKPDRSPIDHALSMLGISHGRACLVGDSTIDQRAAAAAGIPFVFFTGGYNDGVIEPAAWASIVHLNELLALDLQFLPRGTGVNPNLYNI